MQKNVKLYSGYHCGIYDIIGSVLDGEFQFFDKIDIETGATYLLGPLQFEHYHKLIEEVAQSGQANIIFSNPWEGADTMIGQLRRYNIISLARERKIMLLAGGDMSPEFCYYNYDGFVDNLLRIDGNDVVAQRCSEIYEKTNKPYKFLFLNGRHRQHRKWLLEKFRTTGLLEHSLYTCLSTLGTAGATRLPLWHNEENLMGREAPLRLLPKHYEVDRYSDQIDNLDTTNTSLVKHSLFNNEWGEAYLKAEPYIDTYFSLVTETIFHDHYSFRTEKIWKPIAMAHPWIAVANAGFYRDMHRIGFKTFGNLIDESFDSIENDLDRIKRIAEVVEDLCRRDLVDFLAASQDICKYNQQRLAEYRRDLVDNFPNRFLNFIRENTQ
jgi:hypothetical protein